MKRIVFFFLAVFYHIFFSSIVIGQNTNKPALEYLKIWNFHHQGDTEGWEIPKEIGGIAHGGSIWIRCYNNQLENEGAPYWNWEPYILKSPADLNISSMKAKKIRMRVLNLSSETNGRLCWTTREDTDKEAGCVNFSMQPYSKEWQEIICHLDDVEWNGALYQLQLVMGVQGIRGDIYIDWIAITDGEIRSKAEKPDINSKSIVPQITIPGISQNDFQSAFDVLDEALVYDNLPINGFSLPFISPGGYWGSNWWLLDATLTIPALKWVNMDFCENMIRGFIEVQNQNPDGRIDHEGKMINRGAPADVSVIPYCYFASTFDVFKNTKDSDLRAKIYESLKSYISWWYSPVKRDEVTGLITGHFEESFTLNYRNKPHTIAQTDLNVSVFHGCCIASEMGQVLGYKRESEIYQDLADNMKKAINKYLWNGEKGAYFNYNIVEKKQLNNLISHTFYPFIGQIASVKKQEALLSKLTDPALFNWNKIGLTTLAKTDTNFVMHTGKYEGIAWDGDVWTMRNMRVIEGLKDIGQYELASQLNWNTISIFNDNYYEFIEPAKGTGHGVDKYSWTAAQYIQAVIQNLFGIECNNLNKEITFFPLIPRQLFNKTIAISNLHLPGNNNITLNIALKKNLNETEIFIKVSEEIPSYNLIVYAPTGNKGHKTQFIDVKNSKEIKSFSENDRINTTIIRIPLVGEHTILIKNEYSKYE